MSDVQLLRCPFCGGKGEFEPHHAVGEMQRDGTHIDKTMWAVECRDCDAGPEWGNSKEEAARYWNYRHMDFEINTNILTVPVDGTYFFSNGETDVTKTLEAGDSVDMKLLFVSEDTKND